LNLYRNLSSVVAVGAIDISFSIAANIFVPRDVPVWLTVPVALTFLGTVFYFWGYTKQERAVLPRATGLSWAR
jgi:hypothetical protein